MDKIKETTLWRTAFNEQEFAKHQSSIDALVQEFEKARDNTTALVSEIAVDLPEYTVHSIEHLDALWEIGSQIVGPEFRLNPVEGFILGCSFLFHDAAMTRAAYPGGLEEIKSSKEWIRISKRISSQSASQPSDSIVTKAFLREQHSVMAEQLPMTSWGTDAGQHYLIEDADLRAKFGDFIGKVAASHWWEHSRLEREFEVATIPAPAPFPSNWSIDLLKLACVLRTADASQIDERRAPSLLRALRRQRLSEFSAQHWTFQNKLTQAQNRDDTLFFAALRPFPKKEANEWWMLHDTLKMVDRELRKTDDLLARCRGSNARFAARRVANIEAPENLSSSIPTIGWAPIDTSFSISDIPHLIENLGGDQLYGRNNMAAIREVVQNAMDAVRLRQEVDPNAPPPLVEVELVQREESTILAVRDNGIGMSEQNIVENLLSFGTSGWLRDSAIGEYTDKFPEETLMSGRYGIGFFSIFMLGENVNVCSRRFESNPDQTSILSFSEGLNARPILSQAKFSERMTAGGTSVEVELKIADFGNLSRQGVRGFKADKIDFKGLVAALSRHFPASSVPIRVSGGDNAEVIDGKDWKTEPPASLLKRVEGDSYPNETGSKFDSALSLVTEGNGEVVGRASLYPTIAKHARMRGNIKGVTVAQGASVSEITPRGILLGKPVRAARDYAVPLASRQALGTWASEQASKILTLAPTYQDQIDIAEQIAALGGDIGQLKCCELAGKYINLDELYELLEKVDKIWVAQDAAVSLSQPKETNAKRTGNCISVACGLRSMYDVPIWALAGHLQYGHPLVAVVEAAIAKSFCIDEPVIVKMNEIIDGHSVYEGMAPAWELPDGAIERARGKFYKRNMNFEDLTEFFVPEGKRGQE